MILNATNAAEPAKKLQNDLFAHVLLAGTSSQLAQPFQTSVPHRLLRRRSVVMGEQLISSFRKIHFDLKTSDAGGKRVATLHSLLETAKLNGLNPESYLRDVLTV